MLNRFHTRVLAVSVPAALLSVAALWSTVFSDESISVSATVGSLQKPPFVRSVSPALFPITVARNSAQTVSLLIEDPDSTGGNLAYTISVASGAVTPHNGIAPVRADKTAVVDFTYYAPSYRAKLVPVTVTLDDQSGAPVTVKTVDFYVY